MCCNPLYHGKIRDLNARICLAEANRLVRQRAHLEFRVTSWIGSVLLEGRIVDNNQLNTIDVLNYPETDEGRLGGNILDGRASQVA